VGRDAFLPAWSYSPAGEGDATARLLDVGRIRSLFGWLGSPRRSVDEQWSAGAYHCPACGQELPAIRPGSRAMNRGGMWLPPTPQELLAKCPFDGHSPYNDVAKVMHAAGTLLDTRHDRDTDPER
jgi:hypothetical protein